MSKTERSAASDDLEPLRRELSAMTTESIDATMRDLDLRTTEELVLSMNEQDAAVPSAVRAAAPEIAAAIDAITDRMQRGGRLVYIGAGTSGRLGVLDASEVPPTFGADPSRVLGIIAGGDAALRTSVESAEDAIAQGRKDTAAIGLGADDALVGIAASGRTPYVVGALQYAAEVGALTVSLSSNSGAKISRLADIPIEVVVGPEFIAGSTRLKSGTAAKLVLNMLSTLTMVRLGKTYGNVMIDLQVTNHKLRARAQRTVMAITGCSPERASGAITEADGSLKAATLMILADIGAAEAFARLDAAAGHLRAALAAQPEAAS